jgi:hypothetical protein
MLREQSQTADKEWSFRLGDGHGSTNPSVQNLACCRKYHEGPQIMVFGFEYLNERIYLGDSHMWKVNIEMNLRKVWYEGVDWISMANHKASNVHL